MKKYPLALFIGRFQPFHNGHLYSLKKACEVAEKVIIGIGSSNEVRTENNPWSFEERKRMIEQVIQDLKIMVQEIVAVPDFPQDNPWKEYVEGVVEERGYTNEEVVVVGNNDWTNGVLKKAGMHVFESGLHNRDLLEGIKIREMMRRGDSSWEERVPKEIVILVKKSGRNV